MPGQRLGGETGGPVSLREQRPKTLVTASRVLANLKDVDIIVGEFGVELMKGMWKIKQQKNRQ